MWWKRVLNFFIGGGLSDISKEIGRAYENKLKAANDKERINAEKEISYLEARRDILLAEQGNWATRWIRPAFALPFVIFNFKVIVWDKVLGWGTTDPLSAELMQLQMIVFAAYFITRGIEKMRFR